MNKQVKRGYVLAALVATVALFGMVSLSSAETIRKIHSAPQLILKSAPGGIATNSNNTTTSSVVDLSGGDLDKISFQINTSSGAGDIPGLTFTLQTSMDGGTNWASNSTNNMVLFTTATAISTTYFNVPVSGTKARLTTTFLTNTSFYNLKIWALPSAD